ncbi:MAG: hypothetical protein ACFNKE_06235, partial [Neisseria elongata]
PQRIDFGAVAGGVVEGQLQEEFLQFFPVGGPAGLPPEATGGRLCRLYRGQRLTVCLEIKK